MKRARLRRWALELLLLAGVYAAVTAWRSRDALPTDGRMPAPAFELLTPSGQPVRLDSLKGKTVLLHFWATWCRVCRLEHSMMKALHEGLAPDQALLAIVSSTDAEAVRRYVRDEQLPYPVLLGTPEVKRAYRVSAFPTNYIVDPTGNVASHTVGLSTRLGLRARMGLAED